MKTIYLHIGMPKTGTSAIQQFLAMNREVLKTYGYLFPRFSTKFPEVALNRTGQFLKYVYQDPRPDIFYQIEDELKQMMEEYDNIILSEEGIWRRQSYANWWSSVKTWGESLGVTIKIVVYLRAQNELIESIWNQKIKGFDKWTETFGEYLKNEDYSFLPLDYEKALDEIAGYFGKDCLIVRCYDFPQFKGGTIYEDFLDAIGLEITDEYVKDENATNISLPHDSVEIKRFINQNAVYSEYAGVNFYDPVIRDAYAGIRSGIGKKEKLTFFAPEQEEAVKKRYESTNRAVAEKYFGRSDGMLFTEKPSLPQWKPDDMQLLSDAVRIMAGADTFLYKRIEEQQQQMKDIIKLINKNKRISDKKIEKANIRIERLKEKNKKLQEKNRILQEKNKELRIQHNKLRKEFDNTFWRRVIKKIKSIFGKDKEA